MNDREYEARYATPERLAKPASTEHCDFCGARPGDLHAFDCIALDDELESLLSAASGEKGVG